MISPLHLFPGGEQRDLAEAASGFLRRRDDVLLGGVLAALFYSDDSWGCTTSLPSVCELSSG